VGRKGQAEELRSGGRLVRGVGAGARDGGVNHDYRRDDRHEDYRRDGRRCLEVDMRDGPR